MARSDLTSVDSRINPKFTTLLVGLFIAGYFLNWLFQADSIDTFHADDLNDALVLGFCLFALHIARSCAHNGSARDSSLFSICNFLNLSCIATLGLALVVGAVVPSASSDCTVLMGCISQIVTFIALIKVGWAGCVIFDSKWPSFYAALAFSISGSLIMLLPESTANLGIVLPLVALFIATVRDIGVPRAK